MHLSEWHFLFVCSDVYEYLMCENIILYLQELQNVVLQTAFHEVAAQDYLVASVDEEECGQIVDVVNA